ncbi:MAG: ADP-ribosylglycohydrolase family protein [Clostridium sp.]|nr:ADP-ribosylglycohydrolase family protein [Clostridium sp.]
MKAEWIEKIYAGWLAKIIGIRLGAPVEGWTYEQIKEVYGELKGYPVAYRRFAADDDSNGPLFFLRALEDSMARGKTMTADDVGEALLNYAPYEHGFFWWGGYGCSTEHTAYLNLRQGIPAPQSGSIAQNGRTMAEQIGGQIFIDTWGLVAPGNPDLAAQLAKKAASVTHDGNGIYGGIFIAVCISWAFVEQDIHAILEKGLSYIPADCAYAKLVREIIKFHEEHPERWEECFSYIHDNHGYDRYSGNCHILPNIAVMILALLYGRGDFSETITICCRCGWDTDCNVGNVAAIMGVRGGLEAIEERWRLPINDFLACSSVIGSLNIQDIPYGACYIAKLAWKLAGEALPKPFDEIVEKRIHGCHFEFPGSTHAMEVRAECRDLSEARALESYLLNTAETAFTGDRCLRVHAYPVRPGERLCVYQRTYLFPEDFHDSRYDPAFSPLVYPGQKIHGSVMLPESAPDCKAFLYVRNARTKELYLSGEYVSEKGKWTAMEYEIPAMEGVLLDEMGFAFELCAGKEVARFTAFVDDLFADGAPCYSVDFQEEVMEAWTSVHREVSQFTRLKGNLYLEEGKLHLSCADFGEAYTGRYDWTDYKAQFLIVPHAGKQHYGCVRVQGGVRGYFAGFGEKEEFVILKNTRQGLQKLAGVPYSWRHGQEYKLEIEAMGNKIIAAVGDVSLEAVDGTEPYLTGAAGLAVRQGSHLSYRKLKIEGRTDKCF